MSQRKIKNQNAKCKNGSPWGTPFGGYEILDSRESGIENPESRIEYKEREKERSKERERETSNTNSNSKTVLRNEYTSAVSS